MSLISPVSALLFDLDGTVADNSWAHYLAWEKTLALMGLTLTHKQFRRDLAHRNTRDSLGVLFPDLPGTERFEELVQFRHDTYRQLLPSVHIRDGFFDLRAQARRLQVPCALVTGASESSCYRTLAHLEIEEEFELIVTGSLVTESKPSPALYDFAIESLGVESRGCLAFEDTPQGARSALDAGIGRVLVLGEVTTGADFFCALTRITSFHDVHLFDAHHEGRESGATVGSDDLAGSPERGEPVGVCNEP